MSAAISSTARNSQVSDVGIMISLQGPGEELACRLAGEQAHQLRQGWCMIL